MSDQIQDPNFEAEMSMLHLSAAAHHHLSAAVPPKGASASLEKGNSAKRSSHLSALSSYEPSSKRANLNQASPPPPSAAAVACGGYTKLPLPMSFPVSTRPHLSRTFSEPVHYHGGHTLSEIPNTFGAIMKSPPQETSNAQRNCAVHQPIQRTVSDPSALAYLGTPQGKKSSGSPSCGESPSFKRLRRMKERMKEMSEWWNEVLSEGDEENGEFENNNADHIPKEESEIETEDPSHEAVWVETVGGNLVIHFRCPCGDGYQILLSGNECYYKLTSI